ncbi:organoarsenical effux MFS transporter ArsJ [Methylophaga sp. OBS3]|uniref:organoarsenical effux MFS transporter ArsJ n=1 Tax=Methylophaga sp. OBS3 TaxID=2991934 RepID=UPI00224E2884|nr:organoarsenical effux MFS transporter ArsJ [Methylophaga sp. OBS3]MCX4189886.1 organoarsenical effux MFS transporter ArsJ [Methylophaga sp. OBS3]
MLAKLSALPDAVRQYLVVTVSYWAFTLTDGALRMLVVLFFHQLGYSPLEVAMLFVLYEFFGIVTNLFGGWLGARLGLNITLHLGLFIQIVALAMLLVDPAWLTVAYVMVAQALSGIAKDLNKMSAKSSIKMLVDDAQQNTLYKWIAALTGSKNALKGVGFFVGAALLYWISFRGALLVLMGLLLIVLIWSLVALKRDLGRSQFKPKFRDVFSKSQTVNYLSAARFFLFGSRDVWFVVALPVFLHSQLQWPSIYIGALLATWVIGYGMVQALTPKLTGYSKQHAPDGYQVWLWSLPLMFLPLTLSAAIYWNIALWSAMTVGLFIYGVLFAINSAVHSYLIVAYANANGVSLDVGFYYMANAAGRLFGTILSGWIYQQAGLAACLLVSAMMIAAASIISRMLPRHSYT